MDEVPDLPAEFSPLRVLHRVTVDLSSARDLEATLRALVDGVVVGLGFRFAAVSIVEPDGELRVAAVAGTEQPGPDLPGPAFPGSFRPRSPRSGTTRFRPALVPGQRLDPEAPRPAARPRWGRRRADRGGPRPVPNVYPTSGPEWPHQSDRILVPLLTPRGEFVGRLVVGLPVDGSNGAALRRELLDMVVIQAAIAIDNARLHSRTAVTLDRLLRERDALRASEESFRQAFENAPGGMAMTSLRPAGRGGLIRVNSALARLVGRPAPVLRSIGLLAVAHPDDRALLARYLTEPGSVELRLLRADGTARWVSLRSSMVLDSAGEPDFLLSHLDDVEERRQREEQLSFRASHDHLTGLPNSTELRARMQAQLVFGAARLAVLFCDLDDFKNVNDRHGHDVGDAVLVEVGRRLSAAVREGDTVARVGGDEFVVLARGIEPTEVDELARRLGQVIAAPMACRDRLLRIGASIGVAWADSGLGADDLLRRADQRMYAVKRRRHRIGRAG